MPINRKEATNTANRSTTKPINKKTASNSCEVSNASSSQVRWGKEEEFLHLRCSLRNDL